MNGNLGHTYVLIAGAWHGGWVWRDVIPALREMGHAVTAPTLTGLGERRHSGTSETGLTTHIEDVLTHIEMEDLRDVTLVGWSYGGMVITGVASRIPAKIKSLIYLDAFVPEDGKALIDYAAPQFRSDPEVLMREGKPLPPVSVEALGLTDPALVAFVTPRLTPQPWRTFYEPVHVQPLPAHITAAYVYCSGRGSTTFTRFYEKLKADPHVRTAVIETGHFCMLSEPRKTIEALVNLA
jgi:pimeloyl-ACP methyl ester carboxylesterase